MTEHFMFYGSVACLIFGSINLLLYAITPNPATLASGIFCMTIAIWSKPEWRFE